MEIQIGPGWEHCTYEYQVLYLLFDRPRVVSPGTLILVLAIGDIDIVAEYPVGHSVPGFNFTWATGWGKLGIIFDIRNKLSSCHLNIVFVAGTALSCRATTNAIFSPSS